MNFNSIKVQLELNQATAHVKFISHFNSIKVQLEQPTKKDPTAFRGFQFHKGTIRTRGLIA